MALTKATFSMISGATGNVWDYGASPSASAATNDAAFAAALAAHDSVFVPAGTYSVSATIQLVGKELHGDSLKSTVIQPTAAVTTCISLAGVQAKLQNISIDGQYTTNAVGVLLGAGVVFPGLVRNVVIEKFTGASAYGMHLKDAVGVDCENVNVEYCNTALYIAGSIGSLPTYSSFRNCYFQRSTTVGAYITRAHGILFENCLFEFNLTNGVLISTLDIVERVTFNNCWIEKNYQGSSGQYQFSASANAGVCKFITVRNCYFYPGSAEAAFFSDVQDITFMANDIPDRAGTVNFTTLSSGSVLSQKYSLGPNVVNSSGLMQVYAIPRGENAIATATPTTIYALPAGGAGRYDIVAYLANSGNVGNFTATATVLYDGTDARIIASNGGKLVLTLSGANIQVEQTAGSTQTVRWRVWQIV